MGQKIKPPDLEKYLGVNQHRYAKYYEGSRQYSMCYSDFVRLVRESGSNRTIRKTALVDLDVFDAYLEQFKEEENGVQKKK